MKPLIKKVLELLSAVTQALTAKQLTKAFAPDHVIRRAMSWILLGISLAFTMGAFQYATHLRFHWLQQEQRTHVFRNLITASGCGLVILDPDGKIIEWGPGAEKIFGWKSYEVRGSTPDFMMPEKYRAIHVQAMQKRRFDVSQQMVAVDCWAYQKSGKLMPIHVVVASFRNHRGYYHVAMFTLPENRRNIDAMEVPKELKPPPAPAPGPVESSPYPAESQP